MESLSLLQTNFCVTGSIKAADAFNSTVQSGAIRVLRLEEFIKQNRTASRDIHSKTSISTLSTVVVVVMLECIKRAIKDYVCMRVTDLRGADCVLIYERNESTKKPMRMEMYSVICLLKANVIHLKDALYLESNENNILLLGRAINVGTCKHVSFTDGPCSNAIDTSVSIYCPTHTAGSMTTPNSVGLRLYEDLSLVDSARARMQQLSKQIHFSSTFTFNEIIDHIIDCQVQLEPIRTIRLKSKKSSLEHTADKAEKLIEASTIKPYAKLKTCLQEEGKSETTRAMLCKKCQVVAVVPPEGCIKSGHSLETIHVKVHRYRCNTCSKVYKTVRRYGPSFPCSICFTNMWISTTTGPLK